MFALRLGSYWMLLTVAGMPSLLRLKSMTRYLRLLPPPMWRTVILPALFLPPDLALRLVARELFLVVGNGHETARRGGGFISLDCHNTCILLS